MWHSSENPSDQPIADLTHPLKGLPKEFCTAPYTVTQGWADAVRTQGVDGLVHWLRLDHADGRGIALFATGPDDGKPGFAHEPFPLVGAARGDAFAGGLPESLFTVVEVPSDEEIERGSIHDIPGP